ncbi:MAG: hypothetical protein U0232_22950 [Thermomicrobiales bacterium]
MAASAPGSDGKISTPADQVDTFLAHLCLPEAVILTGKRGDHVERVRHLWIGASV